MRAAKGGPQALFELPPREGFSPSDQGHFSGLSAGSQIIRGGQNQFGTVMWSAGDGGSFECGKGFARLARIYGKEDDQYGAHRPDIEMLWLYDSKWLARFNGYDKIPANLRVILETNADVLLETNEGVSVNAESAVDGGVQVIALVPDDDGHFDLDAARAQITPAGSTA
jgi:hypothetical protein